MVCRSQCNRFVSVGFLPKSAQMTTIGKRLPVLVTRLSPDGPCIALTTLQPSSIPPQQASRNTGPAGLAHPHLRLRPCPRQRRLSFRALQAPTHGGPRRQAPKSHCCAHSHCLRSKQRAVPDSPDGSALVSTPLSLVRAWGEPGPHRPHLLPETRP